MAEAGSPEPVVTSVENGRLSTNAPCVSVRTAWTGQERSRLMSIVVSRAWILAVLSVTTGQSLLLLAATT